MRGLLYHSTGNLHIALDDFQLGLLYDNTHDGCRLMAGLVLQSIGRFKESQLHYITLAKNANCYSSVSKNEKNNVKKKSKKKNSKMKKENNKNNKEEEDETKTASATSIIIPTNATWGYYLYRLSIYFQSRLDTPLQSFNIDKEILSSFKENATKRKNIKQWNVKTKITNSNYNLKMEKAIGNNGTAEDVSLSRELKEVCATDAVRRKALQGILKESNKYGQLMQITSNGFLSNQRQWRQFGISVIDTTQEIRKWWQNIEVTGEGEVVMSELKDHARSSPNGAPYSYRDVADVAVRWYVLYIYIFFFVITISKFFFYIIFYYTCIQMILTFFHFIVLVGVKYQNRMILYGGLIY